MKVEIVNARLPDLSELRAPYIGDPTLPNVLTRHLTNSHLQPENMERYGLPLYDLQLAYAAELKLPDFKAELLRRFCAPSQEIREALLLRSIPWAVERYRNFLLQTMLYGEFLGVLEPSSKSELSLLAAICPSCPDVVLPSVSRDELFDQSFVAKSI